MNQERNKDKYVRERWIIQTMRIQMMIQLFFRSYNPLLRFVRNLKRHECLSMTSHATALTVVVVVVVVVVVIIQEGRRGLLLFGIFVLLLLIMMMLCLDYVCCLIIIIIIIIMIISIIIIIIVRSFSKIIVKFIGRRHENAGL